MASSRAQAFLDLFEAADAEARRRPEMPSMYKPSTPEAWDDMMAIHGHGKDRQPEVPEVQYPQAPQGVGDIGALMDLVTGKRQQQRGAQGMADNEMQLMQLLQMMGGR